MIAPYRQADSEEATWTIEPKSPYIEARKPPPSYRDQDSVRLRRRIESQTRGTTDDGDYPLELRHIRQAIEKSKYILDRKYEDEEGCRKSYSTSTWERAQEFVSRNALKFWTRNKGAAIDAPKITAGPEGSIDILWKNRARKLLINIPAERSEKATYYGDSTFGTTMQGEFVPSSDDMAFLMSFLSM